MSDHASSISSTVNLLVKPRSRTTPPGPTERTLGPPWYRSFTTDSSPLTVQPFRSVSETRCCFLGDMGVTLLAVSEHDLGGRDHRRVFPHPAHGLPPLPARSFSSASDARLDVHQHDEHSRAPGLFTGSPHLRHLPNGGATRGRNRYLVMDASKTIGCPSTRCRSLSTLRRGCDMADEVARCPQQGQPGLAAGGRGSAATFKLQAWHPARSIP